MKFHDQAEKVYNLIQRLFLNFKSETFYDFRKYCDVIKKFVSMDIVACKDLYFTFLDINKDKKVCETDIFNVIKSVKNFSMSDIIRPDLMICLKKIESIRIS